VRAVVRLGAWGRLPRWAGRRRGGNQGRFLLRLVVTQMRPIAWGVNYIPILPESGHRKSFLSFRGSRDPNTRRWKGSRILPQQSGCSPDSASKLQDVAGGRAQRRILASRKKGWAEFGLDKEIVLGKPSWVNPCAEFV
jgi:hypothetical protein